MCPCFFLSSFTGVSLCLVSSFFHHQIHPGAFPSPSFTPLSFFSSPSSSSPPSFYSSPPSSSEEGSSLNMGATEAEFGRTSETNLKRHLTVYLSALLSFFFFYCFGDPPFVQACLSPSLYVVIHLYINKNCYYFTSHVLSLYFRNDNAVNRHTILQILFIFKL